MTTPISHHIDGITANTEALQKGIEAAREAIRKFRQRDRPRVQIVSDQPDWFESRERYE